MEKNNSIFVRTVGIGAFILTLLFIVLFFLEGKLVDIFPKQGTHIKTALMLFALWAVVNSSVRSLNRLSGAMKGWQLLVSGILIPVFSSWLYYIFLWAYPLITKTEKDLSSISINWLLFAAALGFVISLIVMINIRIKSKFLGNLLEIGVYVALAALFFLFMK